MTLKPKVTNMKPPKQPAWTCTCGTTIPKKGAQLSQTPDSHNGIHIQLPQLLKNSNTIRKPKETQ